MNVVSWWGKDTLRNRINYLLTQVVQSDTYYKSCAVGVTFKVGLLLTDVIPELSLCFFLFPLASETRLWLYVLYAFILCFFSLIFLSHIDCTLLSRCAAPQNWLVVLFCGVSTLFGSFNPELNHFEKFQTIQFSIRIIFSLHTVICQNSSISNNSVKY